MSDWQQVADGIFYANESINFASDADISRLKEYARASKRGRARLCFHDSPDALLHNMLIVMAGGSYIHPHKHLQKSESLLIIEGQAILCVFDAFGAPISFRHLRSAEEAGVYFYHMPVGIFHTQLITSDWLVYQESTTGPFDPSATVLAPWAPDEKDADDAAAYMKNLLLGAKNESSQFH